MGRCFYWTPFSLGLFTAPCCCCPPSGSVQWPVGRREGGQKLGAGDRSSALPICIELAQGPPGQCPTNPRHWGQPLTTSPQLAKCPTCAHCPAMGHAWGSSWVSEPPHSTAADTFEPPAIHSSPVPPCCCKCSSFHEEVFFQRGVEFHPLAGLIPHTLPLAQGQGCQHVLGMGADQANSVLQLSPRVFRWHSEPILP